MTTPTETSARAPQWSSDEQEDWAKSTWDVRTPDGTLVESLDALSRVLGQSRKACAEALLRLPFGKAAPEALRKEAKAAAAGEEPPVPANPPVEYPGVPRVTDRSPAATAPEMVEGKRKFTTEQREQAADSGAAMDDGSFPIKSREDLLNAIKAVGRAKDPAKAKRHIVKRARALGLLDLIPDDWNGSTEEKITRGVDVQWPEGKGRVDMIVTRGLVPGASGNARGTADDPVARVVLASGEKVAVKTALLEVVDTTPTVPADVTGGDGLVMLVGAFQRQERPDWPSWAKVSGPAVKSVYERGKVAYPGEEKTVLTAEQWALGRVGAFLRLLTLKGTPPGYVRDNDLLPPDHPARKGEAAVEAARGLLG